MLLKLAQHASVKFQPWTKCIIVTIRGFTSVQFKMISMCLEKHICAHMVGVGSKCLSTDSSLEGHSGWIFFPHVNFVCWLLVWCVVQPSLTAETQKQSQPSCQHCRWQVTAKLNRHAPYSFGRLFKCQLSLTIKQKIIRIICKLWQIIQTSTFTACQVKIIICKLW